MRRLAATLAAILCGAAAHGQGVIAAYPSRGLYDLRASLPATVWQNAVWWTPCNQDPSNYTTWATLDYSARHVDATNATAASRPIFSAGTLYFPGNQFLTVADNAALEPGTNDFSFGFWLYKTNVATSFLFMKSSGVGGFKSWYSQINVTTLKLAFYSGTDGSNMVVVTANAAVMTTNTWVCLGITKSGTNAYFYTNGVAAPAAGSAAASVFNSTYQQNFGYTGGGPVGGAASDIWFCPTYGATAAEHMQIYRATAGKVRPQF